MIALVWCYKIGDYLHEKFKPTRQCNKRCFERIGGVASIRCAKLLVSWEVAGLQKGKRKRLQRLNPRFLLHFLIELTLG